MKKPQKFGKLIFLYIRDELRFFQAVKLKEWRQISEENELFFRRETSPEHIRERLRIQAEYLPGIQAKIREGYPPEWVEGAPRKPAIVIRMLKNAAVFVGSILILMGGYLCFELFLDNASPKNFAMMVSVNGVRRYYNEVQLGFSTGYRGFDAKRKGQGELLFIVPINKKALAGQLDTLASLDTWRFEMQMPEQTDIWMNLSSTIGYPRNANASDSVSYYVSGEAFFKIPVNAQKHFEIRTDSLIIQANGAELDIRSNAENKGPAVLLVSGTATVSSVLQTGEASQTVSLKPGQQVKWIDGKFMLDEHPDIQNLISWKR